MHRIEPKPNTVITYRNKRFKVVESTDCHECYFSINRLDCKHIKCSKNYRKDRNNIILKEDETKD